MNETNNTKINENDGSERTQMSLLRFITSGSVDDGKSTLIGRLMYDTKSIFEDQLEAIEASSKKRGDEQVNLALLTDGLKAEREQGITIDVAYRYFATPNRKFIMADTPGHVEYTRNMVTGASTADLAIVLIDARHGIVEQTRRHTYIARLLGIQHIIVAINKMDLVEFSERVFEQIKKEYTEFVASMADVDTNTIQFYFIPISALNGDNVVDVSTRMSWYTGKTVLDTLETVELRSNSFATTVAPSFSELEVGESRESEEVIKKDAGRFPVQRVIRPQSADFPDFRGYAGRIEGGTFHPGDKVVVLPSGARTKIKNIYLYKTELTEAVTSQSVTITLEDDVDISRGDMIVSTHQLPNVTQDIDLIINWFNDTALKANGSYILKHTTRETKTRIKDVHHKVDIHTLAHIPIHIIDQSVDGDGNHGIIGKNDIAHITLKTAKPLFFDSYKKNRVTGSVILIDEFTNETVAAGMIV
jgi:sulfate adenylyltransferase subunit 1